MLIYRSTFFIVFIGLIGITFGCDSPPGPIDPTRSSAHLESLSIMPDSISFRDINAQYDTTVEVNIRSRITQLSASDRPSFAIKSVDDSLIAQGTLKPTDSANVYQATANFNITTTTFATYLTYVYASSSAADGSWIQSEINIFGLSGNPPVILAVNNPDTVQKPSGDTVRNVAFQAKVTDPDGQSNIETVAFELIDQNNPDDVATLQLFDDGSSDSGDPTAGDSVYTRVFSVNSGNESTTYDIRYYAQDKAKLVSDTVSTTFTITD